MGTHLQGPIWFPSFFITQNKHESCCCSSTGWPCSGFNLSLPKTAKTSHTLSYKQAMKAKGIGCDICTLVVTEIDKLLVAGEESIVDAAEGICDAVDGLFPGAGATCNALIESYLPQIIEGLVDNQLSPASVCGLLTLCP